jgi:hypothetical protein
LGQKETHAPQQKASLFDHLVGALQERLRNCQTEGLRGLEIDGKFELGRLLNGNIGGLCAAQQLDQLPGKNVPVNLVETRPIGDEAALLGCSGKLINRRKAERRNARQYDLTIVMPMPRRFTA